MIIWKYRTISILLKSSFMIDLLSKVKDVSRRRNFAFIKVHRLGRVC